MRKFKFLMKAAIAFCLLGVMFVSCDDKDDAAATAQKSGLKISLVDAPGDYEEVNIEIVDVMIKNSSDEGDKGWVSVMNDEITQNNPYNLLDLTGGVNLLMVNTEVPSQYLGQIRLVLGENNSVKVNENGELKTYELETPSAQQSGLKVKADYNLEPGKTYEFVLDFDVDKSIVKTGNGKYILKPVLRLAAKETSGTISGSVKAPADTTIDYTKAYVVAKEKTTGVEVTAYANDQGLFQLSGVPVGTYLVTITYTGSDAQLETIEVDNVVVKNGEDTNIGSQQFVLMPTTP